MYLYRYLHSLYAIIVLHHVKFLGYVCGFFCLDGFDLCRSICQYLATNYKQMKIITFFTSSSFCEGFLILLVVSMYKQKYVIYTLEKKELIQQITMKIIQINSIKKANHRCYLNAVTVIFLLHCW